MLCTIARRRAEVRISGSPGLRGTLIRQYVRAREHRYRGTLRNAGACRRCFADEMRKGHSEHAGPMGNLAETTTRAFVGMPRAPPSSRRPGQASGSYRRKARRRAPSKAVVITVRTCRSMCHEISNLALAPETRSCKMGKQRYLYYAQIGTAKERAKWKYRLVRSRNSSR